MGGLDEFDRKQVRNDYPLLALWEMGIRRLRIPLSDLSNDRARERLRDLRQHGQVFTLFTFGVPDAEARELILSNKEAARGLGSCHQSGNARQCSGQYRGRRAPMRGAALPFEASIAGRVEARGWAILSRNQSWLCRSGR